MEERAIDVYLEPDTLTELFVYSESLSGGFYECFTCSEGHSRCDEEYLETCTLIELHCNIGAA